MAVFARRGKNKQLTFFEEKGGSVEIGPGVSMNGDGVHSTTRTQDYDAKMYESH